MLTIANSGVRRTHRPTSFRAAVMAPRKRSAARRAAAAPSVDRERHLGSSRDSAADQGHGPEVKGSVAFSVFAVHAIRIM